MSRGTKHKLIAGSALVALAILSVVLSYAHLGRMALGVALLIAAFKALLVGAIFMEIGHEKPSFKLALLAAAFLVATMLAFVASDVNLRGTPPLPPPVTVPANAV